MCFGTAHFSHNCGTKNFIAYNMFHTKLTKKPDIPNYASFHKLSYGIWFSISQRMSSPSKMQCSTKLFFCSPPSTIINSHFLMYTWNLYVLVPTYILRICSTTPLLGSEHMWMFRLIVLLHNIISTQILLGSYHTHHKVQYL